MCKTDTYISHELLIMSNIVLSSVLTRLWLYNIWQNGQFSAYLITINYWPVDSTSISNSVLSISTCYFRSLTLWKNPPKPFIVWIWSWQIYMYSKTSYDLVNKLIVFHHWEVMISNYYKHGTNIFYHTLYRNYCLCGKSVVTLSFT